MKIYMISPNQLREYNPSPYQARYIIQEWLYVNLFNLIVCINIRLCLLLLILSKPLAYVDVYSKLQHNFIPYF